MATNTYHSPLPARGYDPNDAPEGPSAAEMQRVTEYGREQLERVRRLNKSPPDPWPWQANSSIPSFDSEKELLEPRIDDHLDSLPCLNMHMGVFYHDDVNIIDRPQHIPEHWDFGDLNQVDKPRGRTDVSDHPGYLEWLSAGESSYLQTPSIGFLDLVQYKCLLAQLKPCRRERCFAWRQRLQLVLPRCEKWPRFLEWAITAISCQLAAAQLGYMWLDDFTASGFDEIVRCKRGSMTGDGELLFQVCEIICAWVSQIDTAPTLQSTSAVTYRREWWRKDYLPRHVTLPAINTAIEKATRLRICPQRLWNLAATAERAYNDLPALMDLAERARDPGALAHPDHDRCCAEYCTFSDENTTLKQQLHKCLTKACRSQTVPLKELNSVAASGKPTAWRIVELGPLARWLRPWTAPVSASPPPRDYIAISHVWSDGTGVGVRGPGDVNQCLLKYFVDIAQQLRCNGLWWDAVCIPPERKARRQAISNMHLYYYQAQHTVIHDEYLLNVDWAEDGSPALALVLSPWFTRGWTALELSMSRSVKVLYRDPCDPRKQLLKDLDLDVLANSPACSRGHTVASALIQRLRRRQPSLADLLGVLSTRTTSWARDRIAIAALLARTPDFDYNATSGEVTRAIVRCYREVPKTFLLHAHVTLALTGGFSWCPANLLDGELTMAESRDHGGNVAYIDDDGAACALWSFRLLSSSDRMALRPHSASLASEFRINEALERLEDCLLLLQRDPSRRGFEPAVLVAAAGVATTEGQRMPGMLHHVLDSHYVGCVFDRSFDKPLDRNVLPVRIGCSPDLPPRPARDVLEQVYHKLGWEMDFTL